MTLLQIVTDHLNERESLLPPSEGCSSRPVHLRIGYRLFRIPAPDPAMKAKPMTEPMTKQEIIDTLRMGVAADIWYDADSFEDGSLGLLIERVKEAMGGAADALDAKTSKLIMFHGRKDPDAVMEDWGFDGPTLTGITCIKCTYGEIRAYFDSKKALKKARKATGWTEFGDGSLELSFVGDLLAIHPKGKKPRYFGDWEIAPE